MCSEIKIFIIILSKGGFTLKLTKIIGIFFVVCVISFSFSATAIADIYNVGGSSNNNIIYYNYNGVYNHAWIYVNGNLIDDVWTVSSGSGTYVTNLNSGDHILILYYNGDYGQANATCD